MEICLVEYPVCGTKHMSAILMLMLPWFLTCYALIKTNIKALVIYISHLVCFLSTGYSLEYSCFNYCVVPKGKLSKCERLVFVDFVFNNLKAMSNFLKRIWWYKLTSHFGLILQSISLAEVHTSFPHGSIIFCNYVTIDIDVLNNIKCVTS